MAAPDFIALDTFQDILDDLPLEDIKVAGDIAVALSGGGDSMALTKLLSEHAKTVHGLRIHALIIDHGIRPESAEEATLTAERVKNWAHVTPYVLPLNLGPLASKIQETARNARYAAFKNYCDEKDIKALFLGHHSDDLFETMLFRLAKGSGVDGLAGMSEVSIWDDNKVLIRPFLQFPKTQLQYTCKNYGIDWIEDFSNCDLRFSRARFRGAKSILEKEGLTAKKLYITSKRLAQANSFLQNSAQAYLKKCAKIINTDRVVLNLSVYRGVPSSPRIIILKQELKGLSSLIEKPQKLQKIEDCDRALCSAKAFRTRTLYGCKIIRDDKNDEIVIETEPRAED